MIAVGQRVRYYSEYARQFHEGEVVELDGARARVRTVDRQGRSTRVWVKRCNLEPRANDVPRGTSETSGHV